MYRIQYGEGKEKEMRTAETEVAYLINSTSDTLRNN